MSSANLYIEFYGVAGAGKTEAAKLLMEKLVSRGKDAIVRQPLGSRIFLRLKLFYLLWGLVWRLRHEIRILTTVKIKPAYRMTNHVNQTVRALIWRILIDALVTRHFIYGLNSKVLINDEGLVQKVLELLILTELTEQNALSLLGKILPSPMLCVYIDVEADIGIRRAVSRRMPLPFIEAMSGEVKKMYYADYELAWREHAAKLPASVFEIKNNSNRSHLEAEIERLIAMIPNT